MKITIEIDSIEELDHLTSKIIPITSVASTWPLVEKEPKKIVQEKHFTVQKTYDIDQKTGVFETEPEKVICPGCGKSFVKKRKDQKACSSKCSKRVYIQNRKCNDHVKEVCEKLKRENTAPIQRPDIERNFL